MKALLLDAWRGLYNRRGPTLVAVGGLMLAMTACVLVALLTIALSDPDPAISDPKRVVVLDFKSNAPGQPSPWHLASPVSFAAMMKERKVPLDLVSRAVADGMDISNQGHLQPVYLLIADPDLIPLLGLRALHGDLHATLTQRDGIAITTGLVRKLWGELPPQQALGRRLESRGIFYTVTAVVPNADPRSPVAVHDMVAAVGDAMAIVGYESQANSQKDEARKSIDQVNGRVYARLRPDASVDQVGGWMRDAFLANPLYARLPPDWKAGRVVAYFRGVTMTQMPFEGPQNAQRRQLLRAVAAASALLLLLAAFNNINLQVANLLQRQRETALRRSLGADGTRLLCLWGLEALLSLLMSAAGALLLAWWLAPEVANWMGLSPTYPVADPMPSRILLGVGVTVLVLLPLTLALPAWMALRQPPAPALQGRTASEGAWGRRVRQSLLTLQLGGALLLLSLAGVLAVQHHYLLHADRGFDTHNRIWLGMMVAPDVAPNLNLDALVAALGRHPAIKHWAFSSARPARDTQGESELEVSASQHKAQLRLTTVSLSFFDTYGMTLLAGSPQVGSGEAHLVIDERAVRLLGFPSPQAAVGALLRGGGDSIHEGTELRRVVAVAKDVKLESARDSALPHGFLLSDKSQWDITVYGADMAMLRQALADVWKAHGPPVMYETQSADEQRADVYRQEQQLTTILTAVALLAVVVAMLGAYALVADTLRRRRTELVLRRLHGAAHADIARHVAVEFAAPLLLASAMGLPLAAWLGQRYLAGFVDRVSPAMGIGLPMLVAGAATLFITALAALRHVRQALALEPIEALR